MGGVVELGAEAVLEPLELFALGDDDEVSEGEALGIGLEGECVAEGIVGAEDDEVQGEQRNGCCLREGLQWHDGIPHVPDSL